MAVLGKDPDQFLRIAQRQRPQQDGVHHAEHGNVGANPQPQDDHRYHSKTAVAAQGAKGEAEILQQHIEPGQTACLALLLLRLRDTAETDQRLAPRFFRRHAVAHILFHCEFEMLRYLRIQFRIPLLAS